MNVMAFTVAIGAILGITSLIAAACRSRFDDIAKAARIEPQFKDLRATLRSEGARERASFRVRGYGWLEKSCTLGLIIFGAANALHQSTVLADLAMIAAYLAAIMSLRTAWHFFDRFSLATEKFNVYHYGFGHSFEPFETALENFRLLDAKSYKIASRRLRERHKAACIEQERIAEHYVAALHRALM